MKIAIVVHDLKGGGAEKMMVRLANGIAGLGVDVSLVLLTQGGVNKSYVSEAVNLVELKSSRTALAVPNLRKYLRKHKPDKILSSLTHVNVIAILACASLNILNKLTVSERNAFTRDKLVSNEALIKVAYFIAPWLYLFIPNPVIAVSKGVGQDLVDSTIVNERSVTNAPNPVLDAGFSDRVYEVPTHPWLTEKTVPTIVATGRLAPQKGFDTLIEAIKVANRDIDCRLIIFGEGELRSELENQIERLDLSSKISLPGYVKEPLNEMASADLFVLSSRFEGSPNVLVEALSAKCKTVATLCPCGPDEILKNGELGKLVPVDDVVALAGAIVASLNEKTFDSDAQLEFISRYTSKNSAIAYCKLMGVTFA